MKTIVDITPLGSLQISQSFAFLPKETGIWEGQHSHVDSSAQQSYQEFPLRESEVPVHCCYPAELWAVGHIPENKRSRWRDMWKHVLAMHEEWSRESNLVPIANSIVFSSCWIVVFQPILEKFAKFIRYSFFLFSKLRTPPSTITIHSCLFLEGLMSRQSE